MGGGARRHCLAGVCLRVHPVLYGFFGARIERPGCRSHWLRLGALPDWTKLAKKAKVENLDPTLRLDLLASSEKTQYRGHGKKYLRVAGGGCRD